MDRKYNRVLQMLYNINRIPMALLDGSGNEIATFPAIHNEAIDPFASALVLEDFRVQRRDREHPLISFLEPGFFLGVLQLEDDRFLVSLVSPVQCSRSQILQTISTVVRPEHLQTLCNLILQIPLMTLDQMKDYLCLSAQLLANRQIDSGNIRFMNLLPEEQPLRQVDSPLPLAGQLFQQRETPEPHVSVDFETALCNAVQMGNRLQLERQLATPAVGHTGQMSAVDARQQKYIFVALATMSSRAAIRGGLPAETSLNLSDLYCQRMDLLTDAHAIEELSMRMLIDYCDRVQEVRKQPIASPAVRQCLEYISLHLHDDISLDQLSQHCGLCTRSLSARFKAEVGMHIGDYIHREKLKEAEYLLRHTDYSLSQIAAFLNYSSQSYFTRIFREYKGMTPHQYRNGI